MDIKDSLKETAETHARGVRDAAAAHAGVLRAGAEAQARVVMSDLWSAICTDRQVQFMLILLVVSLICWNMPVISVIFYPFKILVSFIGQACAVLMGRLTGGTVERLIIDASGGVSAFSGGNSLLIVNASALGTSLIGGLLIWWGRTPGEARFALRSLGTGMLVLTLFYADADFAQMIGMALTTIGVLVIASKASEKICHIVLLIIAVQCALAGLLKVVASVILSAGAGVGEAGTMESLTGVPAIAWALLWGAASISILVFSFWFSYKPSKSASKNAEQSTSAAEFADDPADTTAGAPAAAILAVDSQNVLADRSVSPSPAAPAAAPVVEQTATDGTDGTG